jgi:hypothetical protein
VLYLEHRGTTDHLEYVGVDLHSNYSGLKEVGAMVLEG